MSDEALEKLVDLLVRGVAPETAVASIRLRGIEDKIEVGIRYMVRAPDFVTLPSTACLSANLPRDRNPTRAEVLSAIAKCRKQSD